MVGHPTLFLHLALLCSRALGFWSTMYFLIDLFIDLIPHPTQWMTVHEKGLCWFISMLNPQCWEGRLEHSSHSVNVLNEYICWFLCNSVSKIHQVKLTFNMPYLSCGFLTPCGLSQNLWWKAQRSVCIFGTFVWRFYCHMTYVSLRWKVKQAFFLTPEFRSGVKVLAYY